jgi:hypothetical protein
VVRRHTVVEVELAEKFGLGSLISHHYTITLQIRPLWLFILHLPDKSCLWSLATDP